MDAIRSRKVRRILALEARAAKLDARHDVATARVSPLKQRAGQLRETAMRLALELTGSQLGELKRAREARG